MDAQKFMHRNRASVIAIGCGVVLVIALTASTGGIGWLTKTKTPEEEYAHQLQRRYERCMEYDARQLRTTLRAYGKEALTTEAACRYVADLETPKPKAQTE